VTGVQTCALPIYGGGIDYNRWPLTDNGTSLFWTGLNKGKKSVTLDLKDEQDQQVFRELLSASGDDGGILLTNLTGPSWLTYGKLRVDRPDLIMVTLMGHHDGSTAVDYTVNSAVGVPFATGHATPDNPVNNMLPAWDAIAGMTLATAILVAERHRSRTGEGQHVTLALSDVAYSLVSNLGLMGEAEILKRDRPALGNHLYGAFGHNLATSDGRQVMVIALTTRQWRSLVEATNTAELMAEISHSVGQKLEEDSGRFAAREAILAVLQSWADTRTLAEIATIFDRGNILWGPYQTFQQMVANDPRASVANPMFETISQPGVGTMRAAGSPLNFLGRDRKQVRSAPVIGADNELILGKLNPRGGKSDIGKNT